MPKGPKELVDALNQDLSCELPAVIQYMWHHVMASGVESPAIIDRFRLVAMDEMRHAEMVAERIDLLGGVLTTELAAIQVGDDLRKDDPRWHRRRGASHAAVQRAHQAGRRPGRPN